MAAQGVWKMSGNEARDMDRSQIIKGYLWELLRLQVQDRDCSQLTQIVYSRLMEEHMSE